MPQKVNIPKKRRWRLFRKVLVALFLLMMAVVLGGVAIALAVVGSYRSDLPDVNQLRSYQPSEASRIYSSDGQVIGTLFKENRTWVTLENIPPSLKDAVVAIEDARFFHHRGVDVKGVMRALLANYRGEEISQGASTITMQLARNVFLSPEVSFKRKIREMLLAMEIERRFTKDEILEFYLNQIYFGSGAYGIEAASQTLFGKHAKDLNLAEAAMIAGLPAAPSIYSPLENFKLAKERQTLVLDRMLALGMITREQYREAVEYQLKLAPPRSEMSYLRYPYFTSFVIKQLTQKYDEDLLYRGGLRIYTTMDVRMQEKAQAAVNSGIHDAISWGYNGHQGALVAIEPSTGFIRAMVGGTGFSEKNQFNRAWQARRQPGSAFKVFVYTAAIDTGYSPDDIVLDSPISYSMGYGFPAYSPQNSDGRFMGAITISTAVRLSRNVCAVRMTEKLGPDLVVDYAHRMGITDHLEPNLSLALGASVVSPLDMTAALAVLADNGIKAEPTAVKLITDADGNVIEDHRVPYQREVLSAATAYTMTTMLEGVVSAGTGTRAQIGRPAAGKTGTTSDYRDAWFVGYVPQLACSVWIGNDDYTPMNRSYGGDIPAMIWGNFMKAALQGTKTMAFQQPKADTETVRLCKASRLRATAYCPQTFTQMFQRGGAPTGICNIHRGPWQGADGGGDKPGQESPEAGGGETPSATPTDRIEEPGATAPSSLPSPETGSGEPQPPGGNPVIEEPGGAPSGGGAATDAGLPPDTGPARSDPGGAPSEPPPAPPAEPAPSSDGT